MGYELFCAGKRVVALIITSNQHHPPGLCYSIGRVWQGQEQGSASDVCCGHTFGRNGRYQTKELPSLICSSRKGKGLLRPHLGGCFSPSRGGSAESPGGHRQGTVSGCSRVPPVPYSKGLVNLMLKVDLVSQATCRVYVV